MDGLWMGYGWVMEMTRKSKPSPAPTLSDRQPASVSCAHRTEKRMALRARYSAGRPEEPNLSAASLFRSPFSMSRPSKCSGLSLRLRRDIRPLLRIRSMNQDDWSFLCHGIIDNGISGRGQHVGRERRDRSGNREHHSHPSTRNLPNTPRKVPSPKALPPSSNRLMISCS